MNQYHLGLGNRKTLRQRVTEPFQRPSPGLLPSQYLLMVDIWEGQGVIDWSAFEAGGVGGAFIRLNNMAGGHHMDAMFSTYWEEPTSLIKISYFVYNPWNTGQQNFEWLLAHLPPEARAVAVDLEVVYPGYSRTTYAVEVEKFRSLVRARWNYVFYTAEWFLPNLSYWSADAEYWWAQYPSALYTPMTITWEKMRDLLVPYSLPANAAKCPGRIKAWQFTGDKIVLPGSTRPLDVNVMYMSLPELQEFAGLSIPQGITFEPFDLRYTENGVAKVQRFAPS